MHVYVYVSFFIFSELLPGGTATDVARTRQIGRVFLDVFPLASTVTARKQNEARAAFLVQVLYKVPPFEMRATNRKTRRSDGRRHMRQRPALMFVNRSVRESIGRRLPVRPTGTRRLAA